MIVALLGYLLLLLLIQKLQRLKKISDFINLATKADLNTKATDIKNKIPNSSSLITTPEFNGLTKISFDESVKEAEKSFLSKTEAKNALDSGDKNRKKEKRQTIFSSLFISKIQSEDSGTQTYLVF